MLTSFQVGDSVLLNVPENPKLHETTATIKQLTDWGAFVFCPAAATKSFRALFNEMTLLESTNRSLLVAVEQGYTGDVCDTCGGFRMKRVGACLTCDNCGTSSGCG